MSSDLVHQTFGESLEDNFSDIGRLFSVTFSVALVKLVFSDHVKPFSDSISDAKYRFPTHKSDARSGEAQL
jgi:hypothetical protein